MENLAVERIGLPRTALEGRVVVVTGAGRGIGREIARAFAWLGAQVVIAEVSTDGFETEKLIRQSGGQALHVQTDVSSPEDVTRLVRKTKEQFGPADILINNAILCPVASVLDMDVSLWDRVMAVNLRGTFLNSRAFLPEMLERGRGVIVNMISTDAMANLSAYIASKQGILAFSQSLAAEVGQGGVRVIAFAPGFVDTPGLRGAAHGLAAQFGISEEQFMKMPIHPAYTDAAMPADHAAAATAYLVAVLADEYQGEQVNGYTVLERAGFIQPASQAGPASLGSLETRSLASADGVETIHQGLLLVEQLQKVLEETGDEFNKLPVFVRPMARAGFKSKSGQSLQDWAQTARMLAGLFKQAESDDPNAKEWLSAEAPHLKPLFEKLAVYYQEAPAELGRFTKDAALIAEANRISSERVALIRSLMAVILA
jgi:NAD(P)-dependent dehydrogenase (short-subunit alcohol dehydrogenase family)